MGDENLMTTLDKYIWRGLAINYAIALGAMIAIYVVLDLFFNMDEFTESGAGAAGILADITSFYGYRIFLYFAQLSGVITLFACLVTTARMRRLNELTAVLASGVSLYRVAAPIIAFAILTTSLWYVDTEVIIPSIAHKLARRHDDARGLRTFDIYFLRDRNGDLLSARQYNPAERVLTRMLVLQRDARGALTAVIEAERAEWEPPNAGHSQGRWRLERGLMHRRVVKAGSTLDPQDEIQNELVDYYESDLDPDAIEMRQASGWIKFLSSRQLTQVGKHLQGEAANRVRQAKHARFTTPLISLVMLLLGLPFILDRIPGNILVDGGKALAVCGVCFLLTFVVQNLGVSERFSALPAWLPILVFTPIAAALLDRMRT